MPVLVVSQAFVIAFLLLCWILVAVILFPLDARADCDGDLSATSEYAAMLRDSRDGYERGLAALRAQLRIADTDKQKLNAKIKALETALEGMKKPPEKPPAGEKPPSGQPKEQTQ